MAAATRLVAMFAAACATAPAAQPVAAAAALPAANLASSAAKVYAPAIDPAAVKPYVDLLNAMGDDIVHNVIPNAQSWAWIEKNLPLFESPDKEFDQTYYYRAWILRMHVVSTPNGYGISEFIRTQHSGGSADGHLVMEGRWIHDPVYLDDAVRNWVSTGPRAFVRYSQWASDAAWERYLVDYDRGYLIPLLPAMIDEYKRWEERRYLADVGLFWQYDVQDAMEESISGSRTIPQARPTINSYMWANAMAIVHVADMAGDQATAREYRQKARILKYLTQEMLWNPKDEFFEVRTKRGNPAGVREAIGFIPWYFCMPDPGYEAAWKQLVDPEGFWAPKGITTAERRSPQFRSHGVGGCEWDGAVWPYTTAQTLTALANVLNRYQQNFVTREDYFKALVTYALAHRKRGKPYIGEYHDEKTGEWLKGDNPRSIHYLHSSFIDLVVTGLAGLRPRADNVLEVNPLVPEDAWDWFCMDNILYHGHLIEVLWDRTGQKYGRGKGLHVYADGREIAHSDKIERVTAKLD